MTTQNFGTCHSSGSTRQLANMCAWIFVRGKPQPFYAGAQPRFQSWGGVQFLGLGYCIQNKVRMV